MKLHNKYELPIKVVECVKPGAGVARNVGAEIARGDWLLFIDSDCIITDNTIKEYTKVKPGCVAYIGIIEVPRVGSITEYYETQQIFFPPITSNPEYVVTANCLVHKKTFFQIGGFSEEYKSAAGEDVDLGIRIRAIGNIGISKSTVHHILDENIFSFMERFFRYGRANYLLVHSYGKDYLPTPFMPRKLRLSNILLAIFQYTIEIFGYNLQRILNWKKMLF